MTMKVLHVLHELKPSGAEVMLVNSWPLWRARGVEPEILATADVVGVYAPALQKAGYPVHHLRYGRSLAFFWHYIRFLRRGGFDVVHQHIEGSGFWFGLAGLIAGCRVLRISHNNFLFDGGLRRRRGFQRRLLARLGVTFVAVAEGVRQNEKDRFGIDAALVWNWADVTHFVPPSPEQRSAARRQWGFDDGDVVMVSVGNCSDVKNHSALIRAMADCPPLARLKYLHVGVENAQCPERALAVECGVSDRVVFTGWLGDALQALHAADLYVMPSKFEGLAIAAIEALATGLPALMSRVPGLQDFAPLFPGIIYSSPDVDSIRQALVGFMQLSPSDRMASSRVHPDVARSAFSADRGVVEYVALYGRQHIAMADANGR